MSVEVQEAELASLGGWQEQKIQTDEQQQKTQAGEAQELPLLDEDDLVTPDRLQQERPWWMRPLPRTIIVGSAVMGLLYALFSVFGMWGSNSDTKSSVSLLSTDMTTIDGEVTARFKQLQTENEDLKRKQIMGEPLPQASPQSQKVESLSLESQSDSRLIKASKPDTHTAAKTSQSLAIEKAETHEDPTKQWLAAANFGSYGSTISTKKDPETDGSQSVNDEISDRRTARPSNTTDDTSRWQISEGVEQPSPPGLGRANHTDTIQSSTPVIQAQQKEITNSSSEERTTGYRPTSLIVGTKAKAKLQTPLAWSGELQNSNQSFLVQLDEPLLASDRSVAIPEGAYLIVQVDAATTTGLLQMSAVAVLSTKNSRTIESPIQRGAILILGKGGKPLQAKADRKGNAVGNLGMVLLSGIGSAAAVANQATSQSVFSSDGAYSTTISSREPNYLAGFGQGAAQSIVQQMQNRNQRLQQSIESQPQTFILDRDTAVQVFVNQSVSL